jgi:hypothetical protein
MTRRLTADERIELLAIIHNASTTALAILLTALGLADAFPDAGIHWTDQELDAMITELEEAL